MYIYTFIYKNIYIYTHTLCFTIFSHSKGIFLGTLFGAFPSLASLAAGWGVPHFTSRILLQSWDGFKWEDRNVFSGLGQAGQAPATGCGGPPVRTVVEGPRDTTLKVVLLVLKYVKNQILMVEACVKKSRSSKYLPKSAILSANPSISGGHFQPYQPLLLISTKDLLNGSPTVWA